MIKFVSLFTIATIALSAQAATLNCQLKYTWPKGANDLNYDLDQKVSLELTKVKDADMLAADADLVTKDGRYALHMTAMSPAPGSEGAAFIRLGAVDKKGDNYFSGDEVFVDAGRVPFNRAHLHVMPNFQKDAKKPAHGLGLDCTLD